MFSRVSVFTFFHLRLLLGGCRSMIVFLDLKKLLVGIKRQSMPGNILPIGWWCYVTYHLPAPKKIRWLTKTQVWTPANVAVAPMQWFPTVMGALGWTSIIARRTAFFLAKPLNLLGGWPFTINRESWTIKRIWTTHRNWVVSSTSCLKGGIWLPQTPEMWWHLLLE